MEPSQKSWTSDFVAAARAFYGELPPDLDIATDPVALQLLPLKWYGVVRALSLPGVSRVSERVVGHASFGLTYNMALRTAAIDEALRRELAGGTRQLVILGAGLDARAYRLPELSGTQVFEVDHPGTSAEKQQLIAGLAPLAAEVRFVQVDFERDALGEALSAAGFVAEEPSVWIWEGVTMYLTQSAQLTTLDALAELSAPGSSLFITYLPPAQGVTARALRGAGKIAMRKLGEAVLGETTPADMARALAERGFEIMSDTSGHDWAARYWPRRNNGGVRGWERLVAARRR